MSPKQKNRHPDAVIPFLLIAAAVLCTALHAVPAFAQDRGEGYYNYDKGADTEAAIPEIADEDAPAEEPVTGMPSLQDEPPAARRHVVTSVQKCFDQIGREAALEIRKNSLTPYADCHKRLREQAKEKAAEKETKEKEVETPRNFVRVSEKDELMDDEGEEEEKEEAPSSSKAKKKSGR